MHVQQAALNQSKQLNSKSKLTINNVILNYYLGLLDKLTNQHEGRKTYVCSNTVCIAERAVFRSQESETSSTSSTSSTQDQGQVKT